MDPARTAALTERENRRFAEEHPRSLELHRRARQSMPNGYPMGWGPDSTPTGRSSSSLERERTSPTSMAVSTSTSTWRI